MPAIFLQGIRKLEGATRLGQLQHESMGPGPREPVAWRCGKKGPQRSPGLRDAADGSGRPGDKRPRDAVPRRTQLHRRDPGTWGGSAPRTQPTTGACPWARKAPRAQEEPREGPLARRAQGTGRVTVHACENHPGNSSY